MKILSNERSVNTAKLEIEAGAEEFAQAVEKTIQEAARTMKFSGFRPGKAPRAMVEKNLDQEAVDDHAARGLVGELYPAIIKEAKLDPVDYPKIDIKKVERGKPFLFSIEVEVYPEVTLGKYKGLSVKKKCVEVKEEEVLKVLGNLQDRLAKYKEAAGRPARANDVVDLEVQATAAGAEIKRWPRDLQFYPVGSGYIHENFDKEITGIEKDREKEFKIAFPENYGVEEIAGKEVEFKVTVKKITEKELLPLDDDFAKSISNYGTLGELKAELTKNLEQEKKEEAEADLRNQLLDAASKETSVEVPRAMVNAEIEIMIDELKGSLTRSNITLENYLKSVKKTDEQLKEELAPPATARAKGKIVLKTIAREEKLEVKDAEIDGEIMHMAEHGHPIRPSVYEYITDYLLRRKALEFLVANAKIEKEEKND